MSKRQNDEYKIDDKETAIPFTARLMAYYRAHESKSKDPLLNDPFAALLAGDLSEYVAKHRYSAGRRDYSVVRSYFIEKNPLHAWCQNYSLSQIVMLGAGLDTRAYRYQPLSKGNHTLFEVDFNTIHQYKEEKLEGVNPLCRLIRVSADLSKKDWIHILKQKGFSETIPTFWILEGLIYYIERDQTISLLNEMASISIQGSQFFADVCVPALAEANFGPFMKFFQWGLNLQNVPSFFAEQGWKVTESAYADKYDQGRDVGQKALIFIQIGRAHV